MESGSPLLDGTKSSCVYRKGSPVMHKGGLWRFGCWTVHALVLMAASILAIGFCYMVILLFGNVMIPFVEATCAHIGGLSVQAIVLMLLSLLGFIELCTRFVIHLYSSANGGRLNDHMDILVRITCFIVMLPCYFILASSFTWLPFTRLKFPAAVSVIVTLHIFLHVFMFYKIRSMYNVM